MNNRLIKAYAEERLKAEIIQEAMQNDHAPIERFFRSLKTVWEPILGYRDFRKAQQEITRYIIGYYNQLRPH